MSRDIQDFVAGFGVGARTGLGIQESMNRRRMIDEAYGPPNKELKRFDRKYGGLMGSGMHTPIMPRVRQSAVGGPIVTQALPPPTMAVPTGGVENDPLPGYDDAEYAQTYAGGGEVSYPEGEEIPLTPEERLRALAMRGGMTPMPVAAQDTPVMALQQQDTPVQAVPTLPAFETGPGTRVPGVGMGIPPRDRVAAPPVPAPPKGGTGGKAGITPPGNRKPLRDQSRTEAFDEEKDKDDPDNVLKNSLHGGLMFAQHVFHLDNSGRAVGSDPHSVGGQQELMKGTGAASPQDVHALNQVVQQQNPSEDFSGPDGQAKLALKRMEIIYRHASNNGLTDKANKMAFEMMQYAAGEAAKLGTTAVQAFKAGDIPGATQATLDGYNQIPNGEHYAIGKDGKSVVVTNVNTGKVLETVPYTPEMLFNAALGLSNRSGYWNTIMQRAAGAVKGGAKAKDPTKEALDQARIRLTDARTAKLGQAPRGRAGAAPGVGSSAISDAIGRLEEMRTPRAGGGSSSVAPAPVAGGGNGGEAGETVDPAMTDALTGGEEEGGGDGGDGNEPNRVIPSVLRVAPATPGGTPTQAPSRPAQPAPPAAAVAPAPAPVAAAAAPAAGEAGDALDAGAEDAAPPHPLSPYANKNPYAQMLKGLDPSTGKPSPEIQRELTGKGSAANRSQLLKAKQDLDREVIDWNKARTDRAKQIKADARTKAAADKAELKSVYGNDYKAPQSEQLEKDIVAELEARSSATTNDKGEPLPPNIFTDKTNHKVIRELAMGLFTTNPNIGSRGSLDAVGSLTRAGNTPEEKDLRAYDVAKPDRLGNVVVKLKDTGDEFHLRPPTFAKLERTVADRWAKNVKAAEKPAGTMGGVARAVGEGAAEIGAALPDYIANRRGINKGLVGDVLRAQTYPARVIQSGVQRLLKPNGEPPPEDRKYYGGP